MNPMQPYEEEEMNAVLAKVIAVLITLESNGNASAVGDKGLAVGALQIHPIMVKEANRLSNKNFVDKDRYDLDKSKEIAYIYLQHHYKRGIRDPLDLARIWNGGPDGHHEFNTLKYARKFNAEWKKKYSKNT